MWSSVTTLSATSTGFSSGSSSIEVLSRISPASGASRLSIAIGCGHTVGCDSQWWPIETQAKPIPAAARTTSIASSMMAVGARSVGLQNVGLEPAYLQVMLGRARPDLMSYSDPGLQAERDAHLGRARA